MRLIALCAAACLVVAHPAAAQDYTRYVWERQVSVAAPREAGALQAELAAQVRLLCATGDVGPAPFTVGIGGTYWCFTNVTERLYALAEALPYLPPAQRATTVAYMRSVSAKHHPWDDTYQASAEGAWPLYAPRPPTLGTPAGGPPPVANLYYAWRCADATGDWASVRAGYPALRRIYAERVADTPRDYAEVAGAIGMARLAKRLGYADDSKESEARALRGLAACADYERTFDAALAASLDTHDWTYPVFVERRKGRQVITAFSPEVCRMLRDRAQAQVRRHADAVMNAWDRTWYMTRAGMPTFYGQYYYRPGAASAPRFMKQAWTGEQQDFGQENAYLTPDVAWTLFMLRAYVYEEPGRELARYIDVPWTRVGDHYHILKLVAAIRAYQPPNARRWASL